MDVLLSLMLPSPLLRYKLPPHHRSRIYEISTATVSRDYKITLPKELREAMHIQPGQEFELIPNGSCLQMIPKLSTAQLKSAIEDGVASGQYLSAADVFNRLKNKYHKLATKNNCSAESSEE